MSRVLAVKNDQAFALAAASLRQALQAMPELTEASKHIMIEENQEGLNIDIVDQDGSSMFQKGPESRTNARGSSFKKSPDRSRRRRTGLPSPATPPPR